MDLPRIPVAAEEIRPRADVEYRAERLVDHAIALERGLPLQADVQHVRLRVAEIPALPRRIALVAGEIEQRPAVLHLAGALAVTEKRRAAAAGAPLESQEDQDRVAA